jgi:hypothetical protein
VLARSRERSNVIAEQVRENQQRIEQRAEELREQGKRENDRLDRIAAARQPHKDTAPRPAREQVLSFGAEEDGAPRQPEPLSPADPTPPMGIPVPPETPPPPPPPQRPAKEHVLSFGAEEDEEPARQQRSARPARPARPMRQAAAEEDDDRSSESWLS